LKNSSTLLSFGIKVISQISDTIRLLEISSSLGEAQRYMLVYSQEQPHKQDISLLSYDDECCIGSRLTLVVS